MDFFLKDVLVLKLFMFVCLLQVLRGDTVLLIPHEGHLRPWEDFVCVCVDVCHFVDSCWGHYMGKESEIILQGVHWFWLIIDPYILLILNIVIAMASTCLPSSQLENGERANSFQIWKLYLIRHSLKFFSLPWGGAPRATFVPLSCHFRATFVPFSATLGLGLYHHSSLRWWHQIYFQ